MDRWGRAGLRSGTEKPRFLASNRVAALNTADAIVYRVHGLFNFAQTRRESCRKHASHPRTANALLASAELREMRQADARIGEHTPCRLRLRRRQRVPVRPLQNGQVDRLDGGLAARPSPAWDRLPQSSSGFIWSSGSMRAAPNPASRIMAASSRACIGVRGRPRSL